MQETLTMWSHTHTQKAPRTRLKMGQNSARLDSTADTQVNSRYMERCYTSCQEDTHQNCKEEESPIMCNTVGACWGHYAEWNKPDTEGHIPHGATATRDPKSSSSGKQRAALWWLGPGEGHTVLLNKRHNVSVMQDGCRTMLCDRTTQR